MTAAESIKRKMKFEVKAVNPVSLIGRYFESERERQRACLDCSMYSGPDAHV